MLSQIAALIEQSHKDFYDNSGGFLIKSFAEPDCIVKSDETPWIKRLWAVIQAVFSAKEIIPYSMKDNITYLSKQEIGTQDLVSASKVEKFVQLIKNIVEKQHDDTLTKLMNGIIENAHNERTRLENETTTTLLAGNDTAKITNAIVLIQSPENMAKLQQKLASLREIEQFNSLMEAGGRATANDCAAIIRDLKELKTLSPTLTSRRDLMIRKLEARINLSKIL